MKGLQDRNINTQAGTTVENKGKLIQSIGRQPEPKCSENFVENFLFWCLDRSKLCSRLLPRRVFSIRYYGTPYLENIIWSKILCRQECYFIDLFLCVLPILWRRRSHMLSYFLHFLIDWKFEVTNLEIGWVGVSSTDETAMLVFCCHSPTPTCLSPFFDS